MSLKLWCVVFVLIGVCLPPATSGANHAELVQICLRPPRSPDAPRTIRVSKRAGNKLAELGIATLGPCEAPGRLTCGGEDVAVSCAEVGELVEALILDSEDFEDLSAGTVQNDTGAPLPIDDIGTVPPRPTAMGFCIDQAYATEVEVGYAYAIAENGNLAHANGGGWARAPWETEQPSIPMSEHSVFTIASVSKPLTAVGLMKLLELNPDIKLDDPFYPLISGKFAGFFVLGDGAILEVPGPGIENVTLRHLLTHRSGLKPGVGCGQANLNELLSVGVVGTPGVTDDYENSNFCLLREVIEEVSGESYIDFMQTKVFDPMAIAGMSCDRGADPNYTLYYNTIGDKGHFWGDFSTTCSAFGWYATAVQLAQFLANVRFDTALSQTSRETMFGDCPTPGATGSRCLGWRRSEGGGIGLHHWHNGDWYSGDFCATQGGLDDLGLMPSECKKGYNGTIMRFPLGIDAALLVNTKEGTGIHPGLKSEVTILRDCFKEAFLDANPDVIVGGR